MKIKIACLLLALVSLPSCSGLTQPDKVNKILDREGYGNIEVVGYDFFGCSDDDWFRTKFKATKGGEDVNGVVCSGLWAKGSTVRLYD